MNIRKVPEVQSTNYFKDLNVCYWQGAIYNDTVEDKQCEIDIDLGIPLIEEASNYVCAVERLELSGNNIAYYDSDLEVYELKGDANAKKPSIMLLNQTMNRAAPLFECPLVGKFYSLVDLIKEANKSLADTIYQFSIEVSGCISVNYMADDEDDIYFPDRALAFKGTHLASIFGLPENPTDKYIDAADWYKTFKNPKSSFYQFVTKSSRIDCGFVPSLILLRSNLPFESDQTDNSKVNIVTDFSITATSDISGSYVNNTVQVNGENVPVTKNNGYSLGVSGGGTIVYIPNERRWLNFSAPIPIYNIRLWIDVVYNNSKAIPYKLPPGGVFRVKLGFYQRE